MDSKTLGFYGKTRIASKPTEKLLKMLYESMLKFNGQAKFAIKKSDIENRTLFINKSMAIFIELRASLDSSNSDIFEHLNALYKHLLFLLIRANIENSIEKIDEVNDNIKNLLKIWQEQSESEL